MYGQGWGGSEARTVTCGPGEPGRHRSRARPGMGGWDSDRLAGRSGEPPSGWRALSFRPSFRAGIFQVVRDRGRDSDGEPAARHGPRDCVGCDHRSPRQAQPAHALGGRAGHRPPRPGPSGPRPRDPAHGRLEDGGGLRPARRGAAKRPSPSPCGTLCSVMARMRAPSPPSARPGVSPRIGSAARPPRPRALAPRAAPALPAG